MIKPPRKKRFSEKVRWKTKKRMAAKMMRPKTRWVKTLSILSDLFILTLFSFPWSCFLRTEEKLEEI